MTIQTGRRPVKEDPRRPTFTRRKAGSAADNEATAGYHSMSIEKRSNARGAVTVRSNETRFFLKSQDGVYAITKVHDVSLSGVGIETRYRLKPGERIVLKYRSSDMQISVEGTVAWCSRGNEQVHAIGVAFLPGEKERNSVFFLALRKYLDELGNTSTAN